MILAIDPGLATLGWALVKPRTAIVVECGFRASSPYPTLDEWTDRVKRAAEQAWFVRSIVENHAVTAIAVEGVSTGGPPAARFKMGISLCLSWGQLCGIAVSKNIALYEVPPKMWQHAVVPEMAKSVDYDVVFKRLKTYVLGQPAEQTFLLVPGSHRNHVCDAIGVGVFTAIANATLVTPRMEASA